MIDVLSALLLTTLFALLACVVGLLGLVVPFVVGVDMAERRGFSTERWGALCLLGSGLALAVAYAVLTQHLGFVLYLPALALAWGTPGVLALLAPGQRVGGAQGLHER